MKRLCWLPSAELTLEETVDCIAIDKLDAALALGDRIIGAIESTCPNMKTWADQDGLRARESWLSIGTAFSAI